MFRLKHALLILGMLVGIAAGPIPANAVPVTLIQVGEWTTAPGGATQDAQLQTGGRFVITVTYDAAITPSSTRTINGLDFRVIDLATRVAPPNAAGEGGLASNGNAFDIFIPMEGFDGPSPFVYTQNELNHLFFPPFNNSTPQIFFTANQTSNPGDLNNLPPVSDPALSDPNSPDFIGYELEGNFFPGSTTNFVELMVQVAAIDIGGGTIERTANQVEQVLRQEGGLFPVVIRSINSLAAAVDPIAEAGPDMQYSAAQLTVTTNGGTLADNGLGAQRSDGEDFLTYDWTQGGGALIGMDATGTRLVDGAVADDVNLAVAIANSGLTSTIDVVQWQVEVNEDLTGLGGSTDTMNVSYLNAVPAVANASAMAVAVDDLLFELDVDDPDLVVNAMIANFEQLVIDILVDGMNENAFFQDLIDDAIVGAMQLVTNADLNAQFGDGLHVFEVLVTDLAGATALDSFMFNVLPAPVPEPATLVLFALGLAMLALTMRRRRAMRRVRSTQE